MSEEMRVIPPHGNYRELLSYRKAEIVYDVTYAQYQEFCETRPPEVVANIAICLIHQTNYLLDQQMRRLDATS